MRPVHIVLAALATAALLSSGAHDVAAQMRAIPVYNSGVPRGLGIYGDVAFPNADAGKGTAFGVTGRAGFGLFGVTAGISSYNPAGDSDNIFSAGATLNYRLLGGPLVPLSVTLQGGAGFDDLPDDSFLEGVPLPGAPLSGGGTVYRFPIGVGFALTIPNPVLSIRPWLAPRIDITHASFGGASETETNFGLGGGIELNLLNGLGAHAAYDMVFVGDGVRTGIFGVGLHYNVSLPGL